eukprot:726583-Prymnesium_polylepis.1
MATHYKSGEFLGPRIGDKIIFGLLILSLYGDIGNGARPRLTRARPADTPLPIGTPSHLPSFPSARVPCFPLSCACSDSGLPSLAFRNLVCSDSRLPPRSAFAPRRHRRAVHPIDGVAALLYHGPVRLRRRRLRAVAHPRPPPLLPRACRWQLQRHD